MTPERPILRLPYGARRLLLHSCCAPCAGDIMETLVASSIDFALFFHNPNIHPRAEYDLRKQENIRHANTMGIPFIDADYDKNDWFRRVKGLEWEPERGARCTACFDMRFERTAQYAHENGFCLISSTLGISRWKDMDQINGCGTRAAALYPGLAYWTFNWRKAGGAPRMIQIAKREHFYQQEYCGCVYSLRDTNLRRLRDGRAPVQRGKHFYGLEPADSDGAGGQTHHSIPLPVI